MWVADSGWTSIREFVVKFVAVWVVSQIVFLLPLLIDLLWAFWDKDRQTLHDKIMKTYVSDDRALRSLPPSYPP